MNPHLQTNSNSYLAPKAALQFINPNPPRRIIHYTETLRAEFGRANQCYCNAYDYVLGTDEQMRYVEGLIIDPGSGALIHHAWAVDRTQRRNYEPTPLSGDQYLYFGYIVNRRSLQRRWQFGKLAIGSFFSLAELTPIEVLIRSRYPLAWVAG